MSQNLHRGSQRPFRARGNNRGPRNDRGPKRHDTTTIVPQAFQVVPGAGVSIVLKVDQPTGNEVQGIIGEVLGRGEHPRGIKVRLQDGRVGRVQRMIDEGLARDASTGLSNLGRNGETAATNLPSSSATTTGRHHFGDIRDDPYDYANVSEGRAAISLKDYIKPAKNKKNRSKASTTQNETTADAETSENLEETPALVVCPICNVFEGDEEAVAFHANTHFD
ncbi:hypothetical protein EJ08DRAFT_595901 [Tothia fuscella]|uniref:UBZ4-type domain-containing protein n=1 Tax=Tothia fuscella TaxID=1048955 RepID=A0A9P4TUJ9_9PEZI|nr:hypothetical protein EJ08DRAFT_595901 [Tothia fuscella]